MFLFRIAQNFHHNTDRERDSSNWIKWEASLSLLYLLEKKNDQHTHTHTRQHETETKISLTMEKSVKRNARYFAMCDLTAEKEKRFNFKFCCGCCFCTVTFCAVVFVFLQRESTHDPHLRKMLSFFFFFFVSVLVGFFALSGFFVLGNSLSF